MLAVGATAPLNGLRIGPLALTDVFLIVAGVALLVGTIDCAGQPFALPPPAWLLGLALVVVGGLLGTLFARHPLASGVNLARLTVAGTGSVLVFLGWRPGPREVRRYTWLWVLAASASGLTGLLAGRDAGGRSAGLTTHPNQLAFTAALGVGLALCLSVSERGPRRGAAVTALTVCSLAVLRAGSRAGLVVLVVTVAVVVWRTRGGHAVRTRRGTYLLVLFGLAVVGTLLLSSGQIGLGRHNAITRSLGDVTSASSNEERRPLLERGLRTIAEHPLTGTGLENALEAHNVYVQITASAGVLGFVGFVLIAGSTLRTGLATTTQESSDHLAVGFVAGYAGYLAGAFFQNILWDRYLWLHVAMILWCRQSLARAPTPVAPRETLRHR